MGRDPGGPDAAVRGSPDTGSAGRVQRQRAVSGAHSLWRKSPPPPPPAGLGVAASGFNRPWPRTNPSRPSVARSQPIPTPPAGAGVGRCWFRDECAVSALIAESQWPRAVQIAPAPTIARRPTSQGSRARRCLDYREPTVVLRLLRWLARAGGVRALRACAAPCVGRRR